MYEGIDIAFASAKLATLKNKPASIAVHSASAFYNIGQIARYGYMYAEHQAINCNSFSVDDTEIVSEYRREQVKHTLLAATDIMMLLLIGLSSLESE